MNRFSYYLGGEDNARRRRWRVQKSFRKGGGFRDVARDSEGRVSSWEERKKGEKGGDRKHKGLVRGARRENAGAGENRALK